MQKLQPAWLSRIVIARPEARELLTDVIVAAGRAIASAVWQAEAEGLEFVHQDRTAPS